MVKLNSLLMYTQLSTSCKETYITFWDTLGIVNLGLKTLSIEKYNNTTIKNKSGITIHTKMIMFWEIWFFVNLFQLEDSEYALNKSVLQELSLKTLAQWLKSFKSIPVQVVCLKTPVINLLSKLELKYQEQITDYYIDNALIG